MVQIETVFFFCANDKKSFFNNIPEQEIFDTISGTGNGLAVKTLAYENKCTD